MTVCLKRIISGAQTGVDRAAIDSVISDGEYFLWGGCVPRGRLAEDGKIPDRYFNPASFGCGLVEHSKSRDYKSRTCQNIENSDATMVLRFMGPGRLLSPGTKLTIKTARNMNKPYRIFDPSKLDHVPRAVRWICDGGISIGALNVAGPRESGSPGIYSATRRFMRDILSYVASCQALGLQVWGPTQRNFEGF